MKKISLILTVVLLLSMLTFPAKAAGHDAYIGMRGIERDYVSVTVTEKGDSLHSLSLGSGAYVLYKSVDFGSSGAFRADVKMNALLDTPTYMGGTLELRLDSQYGKKIASFTTDSTTSKFYSYELEESVTGIHDVYLVFLNKAIQIEKVVFQEYAEGGNEYAMYNEPSYLKDIQNTGKKDLIYTLIELGLIEPFMADEYNPYIGITRGDYAVTIAKILGYNGDSKMETGFTDVSAENDYSGAIGYLQQNGVIFGEGGGLFNPDVYIKAEDALTMAVRALGYETVVVSRGKGYPNGYIAMANDLNLTNGVAISGRLTRNDLVNLVNNILNANYLETVGFSGGYEEMVQVKGIMSKTRNLYKGEGLISANSFTTLAAPVESVEDGQVLIGDEVFYVGKTYASALLGYDVNFYYHENDGEKTLVSVSPKNNLTVTTADTSSGDVINELTEKRFDFYDAQKDKEVKNSIATDVHIIYNGKAIDAPLDTMLDSNRFCGRVMLVESSEKTLIIEEYVSVWAKTVQHSRNKVFDGLTETNMVFDTEEDDIALFQNGAAVLFSTLANNSVLTVYKSKNKSGDKLIRINISTLIEEGKITSISDDEIFIDEVGYPVSKEATQSFWLGMEGEFLLNDCGEIVAYSQSEASDYRIGVLTKFAPEENFDTTVKLQIFEDSNDFGVYECEKKITIDGVKLSDFDSILNGNDNFDGLNNMKVENTLIRYRVNEEGKIAMIDTYVSVGGGHDDTFTRLTEANTAFRFNGTSKLFTRTDNYAIAPYSEAPALFGYKKAGDAETLFYGKNLTDYKSSSYAWNAESMTGEVYCLDKEKPLVSHVVWQDAGGGSNWDYPFVVSGKGGMMVEGDTAISIKGYRNSESCSYYIKEDKYNSDDATMAKVRNILDYIHPGDAIKVVATSDGEIVDCELMFLANGADISEGGISVVPNKNNGYGVLDSVSRLKATIYGEVAAVMDDFIKIEFAPDTYEYVRTTFNCMRCSYEYGKPAVEYDLPISEISVGDKVLYIAADYQPRVLCIYEHPELD